MARTLSWIWKSFMVKLRKKMEQMYEADNFGPLEFQNNENLGELDRNDRLTHERNVDYMS